MSMEVEDDEVVSPRADLIAAVLWVAFGLAVSIGSWSMDRLEKLSINPYEVPGLVPFFLGCAITVLGVVLFIRAWAQGGWHAPIAPNQAHDPTLLRHMALVFGWSLFYALVLVGTQSLLASVFFAALRSAVVSSRQAPPVAASRDLPAAYA